MDYFRRGSISLVFGGKYPHCHSVLIDDEIRAVIDAASDRQRLLAFKARGPVNALITSHAHEDHFLYNSLFPESGLWVHEADAPALTSLKCFIDMFEPGDDEIALWEEYLTRETGYVPREVNRILRDGDTLDFGGTLCRVVHTPGHTPGHCSFYFPRERILYLADWDLVKSGPYYGDPVSDLDQTILSLKRLMTIPADIYLTAHGKGVHEGDPEIIEQYLGSIAAREERLLEFLRKGPATLDRITDQGIIYGRTKSIGAWNLAVSERHMMHKHLARLMRLGRVFREGDRYCAATPIA